MLKLIQKSTCLAASSQKYFHTSQIQFIDQVWRRKMKLPVNPNKESPLTYLPDFTYLDGRPTPIGRNQRKRIEHQRELAEEIVQGIAEIDFAVKRHEKIVKEQQNERESVLKSKLKQKGFRLLEKKRK